jgi:hypothetical protein
LSEKKKLLKKIALLGGEIGIIMEKFAENEDLRYLYNSDKVIETFQRRRIK